jgi:hypothetical protein
VNWNGALRGNNLHELHALLAVHIRQPGRMHSVAQWDLLMHVDKGRLRQDRESGISEQDGGIADEEDSARRGIRLRRDS